MEGNELLSGVESVELPKAWRRGCSIDYSSFWREPELFRHRTLGVRMALFSIMSADVRMACSALSIKVTTTWRQSLSQSR